MKQFKALALEDFALLLVPALLMAALLALRWTVFSQPLNAKGVQAMRDKNFEAARGIFARSLEKKPLDPLPHLNSALVYDKLNLPLKALVSYKLVSSRFSGPPQFYAYFNSGELNGRLGLLEEALKNYQAALDFMWKGRMIKENIELLFKEQPPQKTSKSGEKKGGKKGGGEKNKQGKDGQGGQAGEGKKEGDKKEGKDGQGSQAGEGKKEGDKKEEKKGADSDNPKNAEGQGKEPEDKPGGKAAAAQRESGSAGREGRGSRQREAQNGFDLSGENEAAILEEIEKQDLKVRAKSFRGRKTFGDKTKHDW